MKVREIRVNINDISFFGDHYDIIKSWIQYNGDNFVNKENYEKAKNKKYRLFYDKNKSEWKFVDQQKYAYLLYGKGVDINVKMVEEEDENVAKTNAASEIFSIRKEVNKKKRKKISSSSSNSLTFASYVEICKKTYINNFDERSCPMNKPFCVHTCEFYDKSNNECNFSCPSPEYYGNCSKCSHSYRLEFTDCDCVMCGYGTVKIIRRQEK